MTQEDKQLLVRDICNRIPYGVRFHYYKNPSPYSCDEDVEDEVIGFYSGCVVGSASDYCVDRCRLYLRPMSSMTEDEKKSFAELLFSDLEGGVTEDFHKSIDYLNSIHIDYRCLIPKGLALEAPEGMYKVEE